MVKFAIVVDGTTVPVLVVGNMAWGGQQSVVVYEAPGADSGTVLLTGRVTRKVTLTGKMLPTGNVDLTDLKNYFEGVRDDGKIITLVSPLDDGKTGQYVISDFSGSLLEGIESYLPFTMELTEYRQANIKRSQVNLIAFEPAQRVRELIKQRGITPT